MNVQSSQKDLVPTDPANVSFAMSGVAESQASSQQDQQHDHTPQVQQDLKQDPRLATQFPTLVFRRRDKPHESSDMKGAEK